MLVVALVPPMHIVAVVLFVTGAILHASGKEKWGHVCVAAGLAASIWPW